MVSLLMKATQEVHLRYLAHGRVTRLGWIATDFFIKQGFNGRALRCLTLRSVARLVRILFGFSTTDGDKRSALRRLALRWLTRLVRILYGFSISEWHAIGASAVFGTRLK